MQNSILYWLGKVATLDFLLLIKYTTVYILIPHQQCDGAMSTSTDYGWVLVICCLP